ncbi:MAG TPA: PQQ-binding-like beta-propeller repeat protein [Bacteroidales bacterium]|nr:PQQ-binding-like beta-propeller repeat protein [Bacteroidales bacterium]
MKIFLHRNIYRVVKAILNYTATWLVLMIIQVSCIGFQQQTEFSGFHEVTSHTLPANLIWSYESAEPLRVPPRANHEMIILLQTDGVFVALDLETGAALWEYDKLSGTSWPVSDMPYDVNDQILVTVIDHKYLAVIDVLKGQELWQVELNVVSNNIPDVFQIEDVVIVSSWAITEPRTVGYVAGYDLTTKKLIMEQYYASRLFQFSFRCPQYSQGSSEYTVCVALGDYLEVFNFDPQLQDVLLRKQDSRYGEGQFWSIDRPVFKQGFIFSNLSPQPANQVIDVFQNESFALFDSCQAKQGPPPVTEYLDMILVSTGCGELYTLDIASVREQPEWVFPTSEFVQSSFVTLDGAVGYILSNQAEIIAVDLNTGAEIGRFTTSPASLNKGEHLHSLGGQGSYLYAFFNGRHLFVFKEE